MIMKFSSWDWKMEVISCTQMGGVIEWTRSCWKGYVFSPRGRPSYLYWGFHICGR